MYNVLHFVFQNLDWVGYFVLMIGMYKTGIDKSGWMIAIFAAFLFCIWGLVIEHYGVTFWNVLFGLIYISNYRKAK